MSEILTKKVSELTVLEVLEFGYLNYISTNLTITVNDFCRMTNANRKNVTAMLNKKEFPEDILVGGYESRKQRKTVLFHTDRVIDYLKKIKGI